MTRLVAGVAAGLLAAPAFAAEAWPPPRKVFAHHVPWHPPSHARPDRTSDAEPGVESQIRHGAAAGIDGFAVDVVLRPATLIIPTLLRMADLAQRIAPGFAIMPCLDAASRSRTADAWSEFLLAWLEKAADRPATYRVNGAVVVFTYGAYNMPADAWAEVRRRLEVAGHRLFLIGEVNGLYRTKPDPLKRIRPYAEAFDGLYFFAPNTEEHERKLVDLLAAAGRPKLCVYSPTPGYWRVNTGVFARPYRGTRTYREQWDAALKLPMLASHVFCGMTRRRASCDTQMLVTKRLSPVPASMTLSYPWLTGQRHDRNRNLKPAIVVSRPPSNLERPGQIIA